MWYQWLSELYNRARFNLSLVPSSHGPPGGEETRFAPDRAQSFRIESVTPGKLSLMPEGFDGQLTPRELGDLIAFLESAR